MSAPPRPAAALHVPLVALLLLALGLLFVRSSTLGTALEGLERRQLLLAAMASPALLLFAALPARRLARLALPLYALGIVLLLLVPLLGSDVGGARRWFRLPFGVQLQPSELMKPFLVLLLARWLEFRGAPERLRDLAMPVALVGAPFLLIKFEPDLGTALLLLPPALAMLWCAGARRAHFVAGGVLAAALVPAAYFSPLLADYQKARVRTFLESVPELSARALEERRAAAAATDPEERLRAGAQAEALEERLRDLKRGDGYQSHAAQTSIGSGGLIGKGLGEGPQNRLSYLPARHTDFIFAVIAEEWGLAGGAAVLLLYVLLGWGCLSVAAATRDRFGQLVAAGAGTSIVCQAFANVAMTVGLMPVTGIPLPLVSQGGSSALSSFVLVGIVVAVARASRDVEPFLWRGDEPLDPFDARSAAAPVRDLKG